MGRIPAILLGTALVFLAAAQQPPRRRELTPEERRKIEAALPAKAPVKPKKPRKLLVVDYGGSHPSVPDADLAVELMGAKTGAYETVISHDTSLLQADQLKNFDAVYLNNTVGVSNDVFRPELREGFAAFIRNGGGLVANHGSSVASPNWPEFTEILGAHRSGAPRSRRKSHSQTRRSRTSAECRLSEERAFEFTDEIFRFKPPSPRKRVHVLFSIDVAKTDMNQGRCTSNCDSDDGEFPLSWVHSYGKGRVYYCALGHNADVFWDPRILEQFLAGIQFALGDLDADTTPTAGLSIAELDTLLGRIQTYENGQSRAALVQLTWFVNGSPGSPELRRDIEAHLLKFVPSNATAAGKTAVLKELSGVATEASVPVLAPMLLRAETAETARYALARVPGAAADEALRKALDQTEGKVKIGIINSLGQRGDADSVPALRRLAASSDAGIADAAIYALGSIGGKDSLNALAAIREKAPAALRERISDAYLRCAAALAAHGDRDDALIVFRQLSAPQEPEMIRIAALHGLASAEGENAVAALAAAMSQQNPNVQAAAIRLLAGIPGPSVTASLARQFPNLSPAGQVKLLTALAGRGDPSAGPLFAAAAKSGDAQVRTAALAGMGRLGDAASVPVLADAAATRQGPEQLAARQSLATLPGPDIDAAIVLALRTSTGRVKSELASAAGERRIDGAADVLMQAIGDPEADVRRNALRALRNIAGPAQVAPLLKTVQTAGEPDRNDAAQALAAALKRSPSDQIATVIATYQAAGSVELRVALLDALGQTSNAEVLPILREGMRDSSPEIVRAAVLALTDWPDPGPGTRSAGGRAVELESGRSNIVLARGVETGLRAFATIRSRYSEAARRRDASCQRARREEDDSLSAAVLPIGRSLEAG